MARTVAVCLNDVNRFRATCPECKTSMETTREHLATVFEELDAEREP